MLRSAPFPMSLAFVVLGALGCSAKADDVKPATKSPPAKVPSSPTPEERAKALIERQIKALPDNNAAFLATLASGAGLFVPSFPVKLDDPNIDIGGQIAGMNPHAEMKSAKLTKLTAGGSSSMVWLAAELEITVLSSEPGEKPSTDTHAIRAVELLDAASEWKAVAASFTEARPLEQLRPTRGPIPSATAPGPLVKLLAASDELAAALASDQVIVYGTDKAERAIGQPAAKALLSKWRKLPLAIEEDAKVRETRTATWGYAMAIVNIPKPGGPPFRMSAFLIAVPAANGTWSVVAVNYGAM